MAAATARHTGGSRHYSETVLKNIGENFVAPANSVSIITSYPVQLMIYTGSAATLWGQRMIRNRLCFCLKIWTS